MTSPTDPDADAPAFDYETIEADLLRIWQHLKQHPLAEARESATNSLALAIAMVAHLRELACGLEDAVIEDLPAEGTAAAAAG